MPAGIRSSKLDHVAISFNLAFLGSPLKAKQIMQGRFCQIELLTGGNILSVFIESAHTLRYPFLILFAIIVKGGKAAPHDPRAKNYQREHDCAKAGPFKHAHLLLHYRRYLAGRGFYA